jgi:hypothetical protein
MHTRNRNRNRKFIPIRFILLISGLIVIAAFLSACSKGSPIIPENAGLPDSSSKIESGALMMGGYDLNISADHTQAEITQSRDVSAVGDSWYCELTKFFTVKPCADCLRIKGVSVDADNNVVLNIYARHPFPKANTSLPASASNRDDIRVFDVRLVVIDRNPSGTIFPALTRETSSRIVANADGYTDMFDSVYDPVNIHDDNLHPYIVLFEDGTEGNVNPLAPTGFDDLANASGHNVMNQGSESECDLILDLVANTSYSLKLFLVMSYGQSAQYLTDRFEPTYFLPEFNCKEAWKVDAIIESNSLGPSQTNSMAEIKVKVWDWQQDAEIQYVLTKLNAVKLSSDVEKVEIEIPSLFSGTVEDTKPDVGGTGQADTPLEYRFEVFNQLSAGTGIYPGLVKVTDTRIPGRNQSTDEDGIYNSGFGLVNYDLDGFRTYQYFEIPISANSNIPPVARFTIAPSGDPLMIGRDEDIDYDASGSYDVDGTIGSYEWDFDYNNTSFDPEPGRTSPQGTWSYPTAGTYRMALRVKDVGFPQKSDITYKWIVVLPQQSFIAPRRICAIADNCNNTKYSETNPISIKGGNVYILLGGYPFGERFIISSDDYGANFTTPLRLTENLDSNSSKHVSAFDIRSNDELSYIFFDESITPSSAWMVLRRSPDAELWYPDELLNSLTGSNFVKDAEIRYNDLDRCFVFFELLKFSPSPGTSALYYTHSSPTSPFPPVPALIMTSVLNADRSRFRSIVSAGGSDGSIHLGFTQMPFEESLVDYYTAMYCRISPDGQTIERELIRIDTDNQTFAEPWMSMAVDGDNVYVAYPEYYSMSQVADIMLARSFDNGDTWETPVAITDGQINAPNIEHPVNIAVDQNHRIHAVWADNRESGSEFYRNIWYDYSDNNGQTWQTDLQLYGAGIIGDQADPGIAIDEINRVHVVWWNNDSTAGRGVWHTRFIN